MERTVTSGGKLPVPKMVTRCPPYCEGLMWSSWIDPVSAMVWVVIVMKWPPWCDGLGGHHGELTLPNKYNKINYSL